MGSAQSSERSSHFRPDAPEHEPEPSEEEDEPANLINISNQMVERLVDDNDTYKDNAPKGHKDTVYQDKMFIERLRIIDEKHSERLGLTPADLDELVGRIHVRAAKIARLQTVCGDCEEELLDCYANNEDKTLCDSEVTMFKRCVKEQTTIKLRNRIAEMEEEQSKKNRDLEKARKTNFWGNLEPQKTKS